MPYRIEFKPSAAKVFAKLPHEIQRQISVRINALAFNPRPPGVKALKGAEGLFRIRSGDYRIIYTVQDRILLVLVVRIGHRREIYRG